MPSRAALLLTDAPEALTPELPATPGVSWRAVLGRSALPDERDPPALVLLDAALSWADPMRLLAELRKRFPLTPCLLLASALDGPALAAWTQAGIFDYVRRDDLARLNLALQRALDHAHLQEREGQLQELARREALDLESPRPAVLSRSEERYTIFVAQSSDGIWCFELTQPLDVSLPPDAQIAHIVQHAYLAECNDAMARMYGFNSAAELIGAPLVRFLDAADPRNEAYIRAFIAATYRLEGAESFEHDRYGNELVFVNSLVGTVVDGLLMRAWGTQRDVTAHRRHEREQHLRAATGSLLADELSFEATLANVARLLVPAFADYCIIYGQSDNERFEQVAGIHADPALQPVLDRLALIYFPRVADEASVIGRVLRSGRPMLSREPTRAKAEAIVGAGEVLALYERLNPSSYIIVPLVARGQTRGSITLARAAQRPLYDERDLALAEELAHRCAVALDNAVLYREMRDALEARDQLLTIASHELRTPLTAMLGFASVLQRRNEREGLLSERDARALATIAEQGLRMERLISMVLDEARIATGQLIVERQPLDLGALVARVVAQLEPTLERHRLLLAPSAVPLLLEGDELRIEQVVLHLLLNAVKYSPHGGTIDVIVRPEPHAAAVIVRDTGIGIPADELNRVGERFFRARNVNPRQISGVGIGLYVMRQIVEAHGGTLDLQSREGAGTTVTVRLPRRAS
jgi:signal transduction histidine kinase/PAS domain-containing protein